jgi:hypothetical protein
LKSYARHRWVLKEDVDFSDGLSMTAGTEVIPSNRGFLVNLSNFEIPVPEKHVCKLKDFRVNTPSPIPRNHGDELIF